MLMRRLGTGATAASAREKFARLFGAKGKR
jgi:hypothetical protein